MKSKLLIPLCIFTVVIASCNQSQTSNNNTNTSQATENNVPKDSGVYFVNLKNGDTVSSPVIVQMGVKGKTVEPAGTLNAGRGHHHLIVDGNYIEKGQMVMKDSTHLHFGKGQTVDTLKLSPGQHTLTLQFADGTHMSYGKDWSSSITVFVKQ